MYWQMLVLDITMVTKCQYNNIILYNILIAVGPKFLNLTILTEIRCILEIQKLDNFSFLI